jgi:hypothetical protein
VHTRPGGARQAWACSRRATCPIAQLGRGDITAVPSQAALYRVLVRNGLMHVGYSHTCCYTMLAIVLGDVAGEGQQ